jgi:hypothetical protein
MNDIKGNWKIAIHPTRIHYYYEPLERRSGSHSKTNFNETSDHLVKGPDAHSDSMASNVPSQFRNNYHNGKISKTAERKISRAIDYLVYLSKYKRLPHTKNGKGLPFRLNFLTLTLSSEQIHTDHEIMLRLFSPFLQSLRQKWHVTNYIWRAERQASGSIHYHIITDKFIPWNELRNVWNRHQQNLGYITRYRNNQTLWHREGFRPRPELYKNWPLAKQLKAYREGIRHDWNSPNSTDVHSLKHISNVRAYFKKYMTKEGQNSDIQGRLWGCSSSLTKIEGARCDMYNAVDEEIGRLEKIASINVFRSDYFIVIWITIRELEQYGCTEIVLVFRTYCRDRWPSYFPPGLFDHSI